MVAKSWKRKELTEVQMERMARRSFVDKDYDWKGDKASKDIQIN